MDYLKRSVTIRLQQTWGALGVISSRSPTCLLSLRDFPLRECLSLVNKRANCTRSILHDRRTRCFAHIKKLDRQRIVFNDAFVGIYSTHNGEHNRADKKNRQQRKANENQAQQ